MPRMQHRLSLTIAAATLGAGLMATPATAHHGPGEAMSPARSQAARGLQVAQCTNNLCGARSGSLFRGSNAAYGTGVYHGVRRSSSAPGGGGNNAIIIVNSKGGAGGSPGMMLGPNTKRK